MREPQLVAYSRVQMLSFTATGIPDKAPSAGDVAACAASALRTSAIGVSSAFRPAARSRRSAVSATVTRPPRRRSHCPDRMPRDAAPGRIRRGIAAPSGRDRRRAVQAAPHRGGTGSPRARARRAAPTRWRRRPRSAPRNPECATAGPPGPAAPPRPHAARPAGRSSRLPPAKRSCPLSVPRALERGVRHEQWFAPHDAVVELDGHLEIAPDSRDVAHAAAEFAVAHPLTLHVARRVLRFLHVERRFQLLHLPSPCGAVRTGVSGGGAALVRRPTPCRGRAPLLVDRRRQRFQKTRRLRLLEPAVAIPGPRPGEIQPLAG